jgi:Uma2 family endonuclease
MIPTEDAMGLPQPQHPEFSLDDWKTWEGRWELINGVAFDMTPAPSLEHQDISRHLTLQIGNAIEDGKRRKGGGSCDIFYAPVDLFLGENIVQPDLLVVCDPAKKSARGIEGAPDLVVEILSPATARKDLTTKRWLYEAAGIAEYLIVYPEDRCAELLILREGRYQTTARVAWGGNLDLLHGQIRIQMMSLPEAG